MTTTKNRRETLTQRLRIIDRNGMRCGLDGCPVGNWAETRQAMQALEDSLPSAEDRSYTVDQVVRACYRVDSTDRYRWNSESFDRWVSN